MSRRKRNRETQDIDAPLICDVCMKEKGQGGIVAKDGKSPVDFSVEVSRTRASSLCLLSWADFSLSDSSAVRLHELRIKVPALLRLWRRRWRESRVSRVLVPRPVLSLAHRSSFSPFVSASGSGARSSSLFTAGRPALSPTPASAPRLSNSASGKSESSKLWESLGTSFDTASGCGRIERSRGWLFLMCWRSRGLIEMEWSVLRVVDATSETEC